MNKAVNRFWKIYFWLYLSLLIVGYALGLYYLDFSEVEWETVDLIHSGLGFVGLVGLYGFVFSKPFGRPVLWKVIFVLVIGFDLVIFTRDSLADWRTVPDEYKTLGFNAMVLGAAVLGTVIVLPFWVALYRYGFRSSNIWVKTGRGS